jgi:hypothetical protein
MKRLIPFVFTTLFMLLSIGLVTAYRNGLIAKVTEFRRERGRELADVPTTETPTSQEVIP